MGALAIADAVTGKKHFRIVVLGMGEPWPGAHAFVHCEGVPEVAVCSVPALESSRRVGRGSAKSSP